MSRISVFALFVLGCSDLDRDGTRDRRDCAPSDPAINRDATEVCDGVDNDCDGQVDEDVAIVAYWDRDHDGFGDASFARRVCAVPDDGSTTPGDCDDFDPTSFPEAEELCDLLDNDCDEDVDEGLGVTMYEDADGDGHGGADGATLSACVAPSGYSILADDCDDGDATTFTGAPELCDSIDNDCDLLEDEDLPVVRVWQDDDRDGYGDPDAPALGCGTADGRADNALDCDDRDAAHSPDTIEIRGNAVDDDCDEYVDEYGVGPGNEFATVDEALDSAPDGGVVQLDAGFFVGTVDLRGRDVTFAGEGCDRTTWYADGAGTAVRMDDGVVERMTVAGGAASYQEPKKDKLTGGGILIEASATVRDVCVESNSAETGGGVSVLGGTATIERTLFLRNTSSSDGGGLYVLDPGKANVTRSRFIANVAAGALARGGGMMAEGGTITLDNVVVAANRSARYGAGAAGRSYKVISPVLDFDQVTFHANVTEREDGNGQAVHVDYEGSIAVEAKMHNLLVTGHDKPSTMLHATGNNTATMSRDYIAYRGNVGPDIEGAVYQADRIGQELTYLVSDPALPPEQWDLRLMTGSPVIGQGDLFKGDRDGTRSDPGAYGGLGALDGWDYGFADDEDDDDIPSGWEVHYGTNPWVPDRASDPDADGIRNADEYDVGGDPFSADTDADGFQDGVELTARTLLADARDHLPVADAPPALWGFVGEPVALDGAGSRDPNNDALTYTWAVTTRPPFSVVTPAAPAAAATQLVPDAPGTYVLTLTVSDGPLSSAASVTLHVFDGPIVPDDAATVAQAVALALPGQAVGVRPGTYDENVDLGADGPPLIGLGAAADVVIDGHAAGSAVRATGAATLANLTLTGGYAIGGGGLRVEDAGEVTLGDVIVRDNFAAEGGGIWVSGDNTALVLEDVQILRNRASLQGGGALVAGFLVPDTLLGERVLFAENAAPTGGALFTDGGGSKAAFDDADSDFSLVDVVFADNVADDGAAAHHAGTGSQLTLESATFTGNRGGSLGTATVGRMVILGDIVDRNEVDHVWDGVVEFIHLQGLYTDIPAEVFGPDVEGDSADLVTWVEDEPSLVSFTNDGDAADDVFALRLGSIGYDRGFIERQDPDGSRADIGACGGAVSRGVCRTYAFDADEDGMSDGWEATVGLDPAVDDSLLDADGDGLDALAEHDGGTSPADADSDEDGVVDSLDGDPVDDRDHRPQIVAPDEVFADTLGVPVVISAPASFDPDGTALSFTWELVYAPPGSALTTSSLAGASTSTVTLTPDAEGTYALSVSATSGGAASRPHRVWVSISRQLEVPGEFATIDEAIAAAEPGDIVQLAAGEFAAHLSGADFPVIVRGAGVGATVLRGFDAEATVDVEPFDALVLQDLTLSGAMGEFGGAIKCQLGTVTLERVRVERAVARQGAGAYLDLCTTTLRDVDFVRNEASNGGGAIYAIGGTLDWVRGSAVANVSALSGGALSLASVTSTVSNVVIAGNTADKTAAIDLFVSDHGTGRFIGDHLTVVGNRATSLGAMTRGTAGLVSVTASVFAENQPFAVQDTMLLSDVTLSNNAWFGNGAAVEPSTVLLGADNVFRDPRFADEALRLGPLSPARDESAIGVDPDGSIADLGAFGGPDALDDWDRFLVDGDGDGMTDEWELTNGLDPEFPDGAGDPDLDTVSNLEEHGLGSDPYQDDTDGDGVDDPTERTAGDDPTDPSDHVATPTVPADQDAALGALVSLTASGVDPDGDSVSFEWALAEKPPSSAIGALSGANTATASFVPDRPGAYVLRVVASDGVGFGAPADVVVRVAGTLHVPEDYPSVADAVDAAAAGSVVDVGPGVWPAHVALSGRSLTVVGAGRGLTVLDGQGLGSVLTARSGEALTVQDLTLTGGRGVRGGGIWLDGGPLSLFEVDVDRNVAAEGGGVYAEDASVTITEARITDNVVAYRGGGLLALRVTGLDVLHALVAGNEATNGEGGGVYFERGPATLANSVFSDNAAETGAGLYTTGATGSAATVDLTHVTATYNRATATAFGAFVRMAGLSTVEITSSILSGNHGPATVDGTVATVTYLQGYTLLAANDLNYALPLLAPVPTSGTNGNLIVADAGLDGSTDDLDWTNEGWELSSASQAIDAGDPLLGADVDTSPPDMGAFGGPAGDWVP